MLNSKKSRLSFSIICSIAALYIPTVLATYHSEGILLLPFFDIGFILIGLLFLGTAILMINSMWRFQIGKLFSIHLVCIGFPLLLYHHVNEYSGFITRIAYALLIMSNLLLFLIIKKLIIVSYSAFFNALFAILILISLSQIIMIMLPTITPSSDFLLASNFVCTFISIVFFFIGHYRKVNDYTRQQIRLLFVRLSLGLLLYIVVMQFNVFEFSTEIEEAPGAMSESTLEFHYDLVAPMSQINTALLPVALFAGLSYRIIYLLIKREYLNIEVAQVCSLTKRIVLLLIFNGILLFHNIPLPSAYVLNGILAFLLSFGSFTKKATLYQDKMVEALEHERYKISAYLHDDILQSLYAIKNIGDSEKRNAIISDMALKIRNISNNLYPLIVENLGLDKSLDYLLKDLQCSHPIEIDYDYQFPQGALSRTMESNIYRITKELVTNAIKHSGCQTILVATKLENSRFLLQIEDDGKGFELPKEETLLLNKHWGLYTIQQQVSALQGQIIFHSDHVNGTKYRIEIPIIT